MALLLSFVTVGCGGGGAPAVTTLAKKDVKTIKLFDVNGKPLIGATLKVTEDTAGVKSANAEARTITDNGDGTYTIDDIGYGTYKVVVDMGSQTVTVSIKIGENNYQPIASVAVPLSIDANGSVSVITGAIIASISGTVYSATTGKAVANAQVSLSGAGATNGSFASAVTDASGAYTLLVNLNEKIAKSIDTLTLIAVADGYQTKMMTLEDMLDAAYYNMAGLNVELVPFTTSTAPTAIYSEDFESGVSGWTVHKLTGGNANNTWHIHTQSDAGLINKAYTKGLVQLAPSDTSGGGLPMPQDTKCFWYGNIINTASDSFGSFLGEPIANDTNLSGGTGQSDNSGELISPPINLTSVSGDVKLTFDTFWEIESVNPNSNGFDIMEIMATKDGGTTWINLARLNPKSDPVVTINRAPIPFTNTGFNSPPMWLSQEAISLSDDSNASLAGNTIQLKFVFRTFDELYNGFRGWFIDNIAITSGQGTFPKWNTNTDHPDEKTAKSIERERRGK